MDQARLSALIARGLLQAAEVTGSSYQILRPESTIDPLKGTPVGVVMSIFDPSVALSLQGGEDQNGSFASLIGDYSLLKPGDYLVGAETWFVSHIEPLRPAVCVRCNNVVSIKNPLGAFATGSSSYGGRVPATDTMLASNWPASLLTKTHLDGSAAKLPGDTRTVFVEVLLPTMPSLTITHGQMLLDQFGQTYVVAAAELSVRGWRVEAGLEIT